MCSLRVVFHYIGHCLCLPCSYKGCHGFWNIVMLKLHAVSLMWHCYFLLSTRRQDISEGLRKLHCRSLIYVGENSPFHYEALHMTSKLDRRYSALVEVCITVPYRSFIIIWLAWIHLTMKASFIYFIVWGPTGSGMWVNGDRGAAPCHVNTIGVFSHGIWYVQAT